MYYLVFISLFIHLFITISGSLEAVYKMTLPAYIVSPAFHSTNHIWVTSLQFMSSLCINQGFVMVIISCFKDNRLG